jgi:hypothetical protein
MMPSMELAPNIWYPMADLFGHTSAYLQDGSHLLTGNADFLGSRLQALTGTVETGHDRLAIDEEDDAIPTRHYLQLTLKNVEREFIAGLPPASSISRALLRDHILHIKSSRFAYDAQVRTGPPHRTCTARGAVCLALVLRGDIGSVTGLAEKTREVQTAFRRGLLDDFGRSKANFRLDIKPIARHLTALQDSEYLPDDAWQADVVFGYWREEHTRAFVSSPLDLAGLDLSFEHLDVRFSPRLQPRPFRISDLFTTR